MATLIALGGIALIVIGGWLLANTIIQGIRRK